MRKKWIQRSNLTIEYASRKLVYFYNINNLIFQGHWHGTVAIKTLNVKDPSPAQITAFR